MLASFHQNCFSKTIKFVNACFTLFKEINFNLNTWFLLGYVLMKEWVDLVGLWSILP